MKSSKLQRIIFYIVSTLFLGAIVYGSGLLITGLYLGGLGQAEAIVVGYSVIYKILLVVLTAGILLPVFFIAYFIYQFYQEIK